MLELAMENRPTSARKASWLISPRDPDELVIVDPEHPNRDSLLLRIAKRNQHKRKRLKSSDK
jgi:hypothetical protein